MKKDLKQYYTAGELADLFKLPKQTLLYYDKMGVLSPEFISSNNYRHYSLKQYLILEIIVNMRKLGIPISKIKEYIANRSLKNLQTLLEDKVHECDEIIKANQQIRNNVSVVFQQLHKINETTLDQITITFRKAKPFLLSQIPVNCSGNDCIGILAHHNLKVFSKEHFKEKAVGWVLDKDVFLQGKSGRPSAFFSTLNPDYNTEENYYMRPAGLYMTMRFQGIFRENAASLAQKFTQSLAANNLHAVGDLYIMPMKNHWLTDDPHKYIYQISLQVERL